MQQTIAKIDLSALEGNMRYVRSRLPERAKVLFAAKSDAYGHGIEAASRAAEEVGIDYLGVNTVEEGEEIRSAGVKIPILLLAPLLPCEIRIALELDLTPLVSDLALARLIAETAREMRRRVNVQVSVDTGMGRFGVSSEHAFTLFKQLRGLDEINIEGVFSHLSSAEAETSEARSHTLLQIGRFETLLASLENAGMLPGLRHIGNSAALIQFPDLVLSVALNMVRIGTLFYGYPEVKRPWTETIRPIATLTARVISLKDLSRGDCVGYDCAYRATHAQRIAVISIGYGSGLPLVLPNRGRVWLSGGYAPILGKVCLDHTIIDVTNIPNVTSGDTVEVFGPHQSADQLAEMAGLSACKLLVPALRAASVRRYD